MLNAIAVVAVLLCVGVVLRLRFSLLAAARIPASLIAGAIGLTIWQAVLWASVSQPELGLASFVSGFEIETMSNLRAWPGWLIAVVFAGMLLSKSSRKSLSGDADQRSTSGKSSRFGLVAREGLMVWIIVIGQTTVGLWLTWWIVQPQYGLPNSTAMLIETGFAGGHGTAAAMGTVFEHPSISLREGLDLGILMATAGLVYGLVAGMACIHIGLAKGWTASSSKASNLSASDFNTGGSAGDNPSQKSEVSSISSMGFARIGADCVDPLLLQWVWLMLALAIGVGLQSAVGWVAGEADASGWFGASSVAVETLDPENVLLDESATRPELSTDSDNDALRSRLKIAGIVSSFPLFIYTLFGGVIVRFCVIRTAGEGWIDHDTTSRLVGTSMDLLVVAAVMTLNLAAVASLWGAFLVLFAGGVVWSTFCLMFLSKRILPADHWFELGLINFGMSTGTTATGFVLLRVVDPNLRTHAAEHYALAAPLSAPFVGGGMLTIGLPLLVLQQIPIAASTSVFTVVLGILIGIAVAWKWKTDS